jgi:hypothetical protein
MILPIAVQQPTTSTKLPLITCFFVDVDAIGCYPPLGTKLNGRPFPCPPH